MKKTIITCDVCGASCTLENEEGISGIVHALTGVQPKSEIAHCHTFGLDLCEEHHTGLHDFMRPHHDDMEKRNLELIDQYKNANGGDSKKVVPIH